MLRKFKIKIDGEEYLVEMEETTDPSVLASIAAAAPVAAPAAAAPAAAEPEPEPEAAPAPVATEPAGADAQTAPMPGKILDIKKNPGDAVAVNEVVLILEAMKMENQIVAEKAGTLKAIHVTSGQMVNPGDALFTIA